MSSPLSEERVRALLHATVQQLGPVVPDTRPAVRRARRRLARNALAVTLAVAALAAGLSSFASRISPPDVGLIDGSSPAAGLEIWVMEADGANPVRITGAPGADFDPALTSDGRNVAFSSERAGGGDSDIWTAGLDGKELRRFTSDPAPEGAPAWSRDGRLIAFTRWPNGGTPSVIVAEYPSGKEISRFRVANTPAFLGDDLIYTCNIDLTSDPKTADICRVPARSKTAVPQLVVSSPALDHSPAASADGSRIVFVSNREGQEDLFVINLPGTEATRLTISEEDDRAPVWSGDRVLFARADDLWSTDPGRPVIDERRVTVDPWDHDEAPSADRDGRLVAFHRRVDPPTQIYAMAADGSGQRQITDVDAINGFPVASPDGKTIVFVSNRDGRAVIYVMRADGSGQLALTPSVAGSHRPVWSPDGSSIAYMRDDDIWLMDADGRHQRRLTDARDLERNPTWSPDGSTIAYDDGGSVWTTEIDGSGARLLIEEALWPVFASDGRLAFVRPKNGRDEIWVADASGANARRIAGVDGIIFAPWWGGGPEILFEVGGRIMAVHPGTGRVRTVASGESTYYNPSWAPDGRILFNRD